jgi:metal-dependent HD superfamily phosphatase/phosphodiesterase
MSESSAESPPAGPRTPREAIAAMRIHAPTERNPKLGRFLEAANANDKLKARWHAQQVTADRLEMSDHSWVHLQIVLNRALHLFRLLHRSGLKSSIETDYAMSHKDAEVIIAGGCLLHDLGMSIHRIDHEAFSLFLAADLLDVLLESVYDDPERTVIASEILHAIIGHRKGGRPLTF